MNERELIVKRGEALKRCEDLNKAAQAEKRDLHPEEQESYDKAWAEAGDIETQIEASRTATAAVASRSRNIELARKKQIITGIPSDVGTRVSGPDNIVINFRGKPINIAAGSDRFERSTEEYNEAYNNWLLNPWNRPDAILQVTEGQQGGYLTMPEQVNYDLINLVDEVVVMRKICRKFATYAQTLGAVYRTDKASGFVWGTEFTELAAPVTNPKWGKRKLTPHHYTGYINPTNDFLTMSEIPPVQLVTEECGIPIREGEETAMMSGDGNGKPLGIFTADNNGIPTTQDVNTGSATNITYGGLCDIIGKLADIYLINGQCYWVCHRDFLTKCWKLTDSTGQPILKTDPNGAFFYTLMGYPVLRSDFAPNTFTNGLYVAVFGNFQYYWLAEHPVTELKILDQIEALKNRTVFLFRRKIDAMPVRATAFARAKCAA